MTQELGPDQRGRGRLVQEEVSVEAAEVGAGLVKFGYDLPVPTSFLDVEHEREP